MNKHTKLFFAPKAFIIKNKRLLVLRESPKDTTRTHSGEYSLIGGRIDDNEPWHDGFMREVREEIGADITIIKPLYVSESFNNIHDERWHIVRCFFLCSMAGDTIMLSGEHDDYKWIDPANYRNEKIINNEYGAFEAYLQDK
jgi:ADP-ribose pyrophosphatase YjhB (NUDIX family)